jgi:large subunit ribosomal protein L13
MKLTDSIKGTDVKREWLVVDATDLPLGRLSSEIAHRLRGKHRTDFTAHVDSGDNVIVINAEKVRLTGRKKITQEFFWHTGWPGGIRSVLAGDELKGKYPERVVERAVKRMLPKTKLGNAMFGKLHVYAGETHPHESQKPSTWDVKNLIAKKGAK